MQVLKDKIRTEGKYLGDGILKIDGILNHQMDPNLVKQMGEEIANRFRDTQPTLSAHISVMRWALLQQGPIMGAEWHRAVAQSYLGADGELPGDRPAGGQQLRGTDSAARVPRRAAGITPGKPPRPLAATPRALGSRRAAEP